MPNVKPILFSGPMVRALLDGRKTQTRRILKKRATMPYQTSDLLWVREPWRTETFEHDKIAPAKLSGHEKIIYEADADWSLNKSVGRIRPGMFMPRWASRLTLEVTAVRVQRLQEISQEDARAEGVATEEWDDWRENVTAIGMPEGSYIETERDLFRDLWDSLNAKRGYGWEDNPWVAAISFIVHQMNIDEFLAQREAA